MLSGAVTGSLVRELNLQAVYLAVRQLHPVSRAELARRLGTSKPTIGRSIDALLAAGLIRAADATGYGATFFEPCPEAGAVLGLDVGSRYLRGVIADLDGNERARADVRLASNHGPDVVADAVRLKEKLTTEAEVDTVDMAVVGIGGVIDPRTGQVRVANQHELNGFAAGAEFRTALGVPVTVENDVNLAALGEGRRGAGVGLRDFAFLAVGSGVGAGLVLGGEVHRGHHGAAGEIDYVRPGHEFEPASPAADAFLAYAEKLVAQFAKPRARSDPDRLAQAMGTSLRSPLTTEAIMAAARDGDGFGLSLVDLEADRIARYASTLTQVVDLELVVLGGGLGLNGDLLLDPVRAALAALVPYPPGVEVSQLGADATLVGAIMLALQEVLDDLVPTRVAAAGG
ncbi:ROK family transcriptional regulator [Actinocrispum wychmicini]|uniref:Putative NBD/HSP70 family sugar kinase n=1 Tax=Actinocrispum wychmicini TaxID=1213861 RepID=A0A4R2J9F5_9PSEU|nr:ROK family protein [Actinocrispum wychmicini]TCO55941.1 putative NBD/HSP70 family sugar kinase [Actinocrispum wychmicini]